MFWSDVTTDTISRAKLNGSEVTVLVNSGLSIIGKSATNENMYEWMCKLLNLNMPLTSSYMYLNVNDVANLGPGVLYIHLLNYSSFHLPVTLAQLIRPGMYLPGVNASCSGWLCVTSTSTFFVVD